MTPIHAHTGPPISANTRFTSSRVKAAVPATDRSIVTPMSWSSTRRPFEAALVVLLAGWAAYTGIICSGHFLSLVPKHRGETAWIIFAGLWSLAAWRIHGSRAAPGLPPDARRWAGLLSGSAAFFLLSAALYWPALGLGLLSDDFVLLARAVGHEFWSASPFWRPVPLLLWSAVGTSNHAAVSLHAISVALHAVNGALLMAVVQRMGLPVRTSVAAGALFICFPASVEAVAWASGIQDVLLVTGCLIFVLACSSPRPGWRATCAGLAGLAVALGTKETAVAAPFLACAVWCGRRDRWRTLILAGVLIVLAYASVRLLVTQGDAAFAVVPSRYFVKELVSRPFATLAVPFNGAELARAPAIGILMTWILLGWLVAAATTGRGTSMKASTTVRGAAWVLLSAAPVYSMFYVTADLQGSRYLYLPACGWTLLLAALLLRTSGEPVPRLGLVVTAALLVAWAGGVRWHLTGWQEASRLRDRVLASAHQQLNRTDCAVVDFSGMPDSVGGAYVFRNGFLEALALANGTDTAVPAAAGAPPGAACTVGWREGAFEPLTPDGGPGGCTRLYEP
jgi:hypothetical protein